MVTNALIIMQSLGKDNAGLGAALFRTQARNVVVLRLLGECIYLILQMMQLQRILFAQIMTQEAAEGAVIQQQIDLIDFFQFFPRFVGINQIVLYTLFGLFEQVNGMIADALKISDQMEHICHNLRHMSRQVVSAEFNQIVCNAMV